MKLIKRIVFISLFVFSSILFQFCNQQCGKKSVQKYAIETYLFNRVYHLDSNTLTMTLSNDSIPMQAVDTVFLMFFVKTRVVMNLSEGGLYACDPVMPITEALGDSMRIIALDSFDSTHPAGTDVSKEFRLSDPENLGSIVKNYYSIDQYFLFRSSVNALNLALIKKPTFRNIRFRIHVFKKTLNDGVFFETPVLRFY